MRRSRAVLCHHSNVRDVLVVLFWVWLLVALGVYVYRIYRRATTGPKAERAARATDGAAPTGASVLSRLGKGSPPPLPEGPLEARLPRSLQNVPPPVDAEGHLVIPSGGPSEIARAAVHHDDHDAPAPPDDMASPAPLPAHVTLAEALKGIQMPADLLPMVEPGLIDGRRARFGATGTNVPTVAVALGDELRRLGYTVSGLDTISSTRAGLAATRDTTSVAATVEINDDTGAVVVQLNV